MFDTPKRVGQFDSESLFEPFLFQAQRSNIPVQFTPAFRRIAIQNAPQLLFNTNGTYLRNANYQLVTQRLVQNAFASQELAAYALFYGTTMAAFKNFAEINSYRDVFQSNFDEKRDKYYQLLQRLATSWSCGQDEVWLRAQERPIAKDGLLFHQSAMDTAQSKLREYLEALDQLKDNASFQGRAILAHENGYVSKKREFSDLRETKHYMEDYFSISQNQAKIILLAQ